MDTRLHGLAAKIGSLVLLQAASTFLADEARAQSSACDQLKGALAARIEGSGVRDYALEAVPASTPVPPDVRAIGTCEAGRYKILYRRGLGKQSALAVAPGRVSRPIPASAPEPAVPLAHRDEGASAPRESISEPQPVKALKAVNAAASEVESSSAASRLLAQPAQMQLEKDPVPIPLAQRASEFAAANWRWLIVLLLVPIAGWLWAWRAHHNAYDKSGLPRGPRL
jgi:hypothetical protein